MTDLSPSTPGPFPAGPALLPRVIGALVFAARKPVTVSELSGILAAEGPGGSADAPLASVSDKDIRAALDGIRDELEARPIGIHLVESAQGFRYQTDPAGGLWVRRMLNLDKPARLSKPALETLAIIAYRQPVTRAEIESVRGVAVDAMLRNLLEAQLVRIVGRSDLPGRPLLYGTTQLFLEHFGLSSVNHLPGIEQLARRREPRPAAPSADRPASADTAPAEDPAPAAEPDAPAS